MALVAVDEDVGLPAQDPLETLLEGEAFAAERYRRRGVRVEERHPGLRGAPPTKAALDALARRIRATLEAP